MEKEGQVWDDSTLINAFDQAISKYKKMHGKGYNGNSTVDVSRDFISTSRDDPQDDNSNPETVSNGNNSGSHVSVEVEEAGNVGTVTENEVIDSQISNENAIESYSLPPQDQSQYHSSSTNLDEYNVLYKQYYEIEEQRQTILQQMQHLTNEYYPYSGQEYQDTTQKPCGTMAVSCRPCTCQCPVASCSSMTCPSVGTHGDGPPSTKGLKLKPTTENVDLFTEALGAAEKALSTLKDKTSDSEKENRLCTVTEQNSESETDLSTVLNAWYSAGFYTGKYLTEKSLSKKRHD